MPEMRQDPVLGNWVIISEERRQRPAGGATAGCPFCPGNESETLPEISSIREAGTAPDSAGWSVRVVPNKYPALKPGPAHEDERHGLFARQAGHGHHEVIIEGGAHTRSVTELETHHMKDVVSVYRDRFRAHARTPGIQSALLIKNVGEVAGMSIEHSHSQLIATPVLPPVLETELRSAKRWAAANDGGCVWCEIIRRELESGERIIAVRDTLVALCPWAPRLPFESWILPREHASHFELTSESCLAEFAELLLEVLRGIESCLSHPPYNYAIHSAPFASPSKHASTLAYHWRLAILPRVTQIAGYEQASGFSINHVRPEEAAAKLRRILRESESVCSP